MKNQLFKFLQVAFVVTSFAGNCVAMTTTADYEVPVDNLDLADASHFPLKNVTVKTQVDGQVAISYFLPQELTGLPNLIKLTGFLSGQQAQLNSAYNSMDCTDGSKEITCQVTFNKLQVSQTLADHLLKEKFSGETLQKRMIVQQKFSTDPVGIIHIKK